MKPFFQKGLALPLISLVIFLSLSALAYYLFNPKKPSPDNSDSISTSPTPSDISPTSASDQGTISGYLIYPSSFIPPELGVCAQKISNLQNVVCTSQIKDPKFKNGVGYQLELDPGEYYVYSYLDDQKAYYTEFVTCGLLASCPSHAKIPVLVTAGSNQDDILPHDWYDTPSADPSPTSSPQTPTANPTSKLNPSVFKVDPNLIKILPTATPTPTPIPIIIKMPTIKIELPGF
jgi:hypothetical protein